MLAEDLSEGLLHEVCGGVVVGDELAPMLVDRDVDVAVERGGEFCGDVSDEVVLFDGVDYAHLLATLVGDGAGVAYLTAALTVEGGAVEDDLVLLFVFCFDFAVADDVDVGFGVVIADEVFFDGGLVEDDPVARLDGCGVASAVFLCCHFLVELVVVGL